MFMPVKTLYIKIRLLNRVYHLPVIALFFILIQKAKAITDVNHIKNMTKVMFLVFISKTFFLYLNMRYIRLPFLYMETNEY
jgi:uncharacterized membrane protein